MHSCRAQPHPQVTSPQCSGQWRSVGHSLLLARDLGTRHRGRSVQTVATLTSCTRGHSADLWTSDPINNYTIIQLIISDLRLPILQNCVNIAYLWRQCSLIDLCTLNCSPFLQFPLTNHSGDWCSGLDLARPSQSGLTTAPPLSLHSLVTNSSRCQLLLLRIRIAIYATIFLTTKA